MLCRLQPDRMRFNLSFRTSLLFRALILSIRFLQPVLPLVEDINKAPGAPEKRKGELLQKLQCEIVLVEGEAEEFGLTPPADEHEDAPVLNGFEEGPEKNFLREQIKKWSAERTLIFDKIREAQDPAK